MRYLLLVALVFALTVPTSARVIELMGVRSETSDEITALSGLYSVFGSKSETEMMHDNGVVYWGHSGLKGQASTYTAPSACYLVKLKYYLRSSGHTYYHDCYRDSGGEPDHTDSYFSAPIDYTPGSVGWHEIDVSGEGVTFTNGEVFHPFMDDLSVSGTSDDQGTIAGGTGGPDGSNWWQFTNDNWTAYHESFGAALVRVFINDDMDGPVAAAQDPADGDNGVSVDTDILFDIDDADIGVDSGTIVDGSVTVDQDIPTKGKIDVPGLLTYDDTDPNNVHVTFNPISDFEEGAIVTVTVSPAGTKITDDLGNEMAEDSWTFDIIPSGVEAASLGTIKAEFK